MINGLKNLCAFGHWLSYAQVNISNQLMYVSPRSQLSKSQKPEANIDAYNLGSPI